MTAETQHTPGPWGAVTDGHYYVGYPRPGNESRLDDVLGAPDGLSNTYLMAASPEMLGDLIEAERVFRHYGDLHAAKPDPVKAARNYEMADRLAATIAKATKGPDHAR